MLLSRAAFLDAEAQFDSLFTDIDKQHSIQGILRIAAIQAGQAVELGGCAALIF